MLFIDLIDFLLTAIGWVLNILTALFLLICLYFIVTTDNPIMTLLGMCFGLLVFIAMKD